MIRQVWRGDGLAAYGATNFDLSVHVFDDLRRHSHGAGANAAKDLVGRLALPAARGAHKYPAFCIRALTRLVDDLTAV